MATAPNSQKSRNVTTRTPGENPSASQMPPQAEAEQTTGAPETQPEQGAAGFTDEQQAAIDAEVQRRLDEAGTADQEMLIEAEVQRRVKAQRRAAAGTVVQADDLPPQNKVDPKKITRAKLTRDGYVCPAPTGSKSDRHV